MRNKLIKQMTKEELSEYRKEYYRKHREQRIEYAKKYYQNHKVENQRKAKNRYRIKCGLKPLKEDK